MRRMKIAVARRGYSGTGGAEAYLRRFAESALRQGHECVLFTAAPWPAEQWPGSIERVPLGGSARGFAELLRRARVEEKCDVFFSLERVFACDVYRAGDGVHAGWLERRARFESPWREWVRCFNPKHREVLALERALFAERGAQRVIANSEMVKREIVERFGYPAERVDVIYNGAPAAEIPDSARAKVRAELGIAADDYVTLFVGSGWERKGLRFAMEAMDAAALPQAHLLVAGSGRARALPSSARTHFLGPRHDVPRLLAAADVFILPTIYDPFSNACLEALAAGLPVITTLANGLAEIIESGVDGEIVKAADDIIALSAALRAWASQDRRAAMRQRLRAKGAEFSIERNVRATLAVLARARGGKTRT